VSDDIRAGYIAGLRLLADLLDANPDLILPRHGQENMPLTWSFMSFARYVDTDPREAMAATEKLIPARPWRKAYRDEDTPYAMFELSGALAGLHVRLRAYRDAVCTRVVTGTREVTEEVPDPEALARVPVTKVTRIVEDVEWSCHPILAPPEPGSPAEGGDV